MKLLELENVPIFSMLQMEEALLRGDKNSWCLINHGAPKAIVLGSSGKPDELIHLSLAKERNIPLVKRFSGGGTVFIDEETLFISFILNSDELNISPFPKSVLEWTKTLYSNLLPLSLKENDYTIGNRKFGGNAQYFSKKRFLHHSSLLWNFSNLNMDLLKMPPKMPAYRMARPHADFLTALSDHLPSKKQFLDDFINLLISQFRAEKAAIEEVLTVSKKPHRKATELIHL